MLNLFRYISLRRLRYKSTRTLLTTLGVAIGVALFVAIRLINSATLRAFDENVTAIAGQADLTVSAGEAGFPEEKLEQIETVRGVRRAVPMLEENTFLVSDSFHESMTVFGVDLLREPAVRSYKTTQQEIMDDPLVFLNQADSIIISETLAQQHNLKFDSKIKLITAQGAQTFTVRGILQMEGVARAFGGAMAIMDIDGARASFGKENSIDRIDIVLKPNVDTKKVIADLKETLGPGYVVERPRDQVQSLSRLVDSYQKILVMIGSFAIFVGLLLVANVMNVSVMESRREIGILRSLGASRPSILVLFLFDAAVIGAIGALVGTVLGYFAAGQLIDSVAHSLANQYALKFPAPRIALTAMEVAKTLILGIAASMIAAFWPSLKAARIQPVEAMAARGSQLPLPQTRLIIYLGLFGLALLSVLVISSWLGAEEKFAWATWLHQGLGIPSVVLMTPLFTITITRIFSWIVQKGIRDISLRLSLENLLRDPVRAASNVLTLGLGLILVIIVTAVNSSFRYSIDGWLDRVLTADLVISSGTSGSAVALKPLALRANMKEVIESVPELRQQLAAPIYGMRFAHIQYQDRTIAVKAMDDAGPASGYVQFDIVNSGDRLKMIQKFFASKTPALFVSRNFSKHFSKNVGDLVPLKTPIGEVEFPIAAIVNDFASSDGVIYMSRTVFSHYWSENLVSAFYADLKTGADPVALKRIIENTLGPTYMLSVHLNGELKDQIASSVDQSFAYSKAIEFASLLSALFGMINMMLISILERTRELGLLRAVGMSRGQMSRMVLGESLVQGFIAGLLAVSAGVLLSYLWITHSLSALLGWTIEFYFPRKMIAVSLVLGLFVSMIAGILPARRAARLQIKEALAYE